MQFEAFDTFISIVADRYGKPGTPSPEEQSSDYESGVVKLGNETWRIRTARLTPRKSGAFVALWRRDENGDTCAFGVEENIDGLLVFVSEESRFGVFRFPSTELSQLGYTKSSGNPGKRGFRVYPSWSTGLNRQAMKTQEAQNKSFHLLAENS